MNYRLKGNLKKITSFALVSTICLGLAWTINSMIDGSILSSHSVPKMVGPLTFIAYKYNIILGSIVMWSAIVCVVTNLISLVKDLLD